jgi:ketosteroid isomerase-like protein
VARYSTDHGAEERGPARAVLFPGGGSYGLEAALDRITALHDLFDELRWEPQEFVDAGERVVVIVLQVVRGRSSGVTLREPVVHLWLLEAGHAKELSVYTERSEALAAIGRSE